MEDLYKQLNTKVGLANSQYLNDVWSMLCTDEEAKLANLLPGSVEDLAVTAGKDKSEIKSLLASLFQKGVAFKSVRDGIPVYKLAKNIVQFHDASLLWEGATQEYYEVWKKVMDEEFTGFMKSLPADFELPSFMRVIPINESVDSKSEILTYEECEKLIDESENIAVVKCPCRLSQQGCEAPVENCIQINRGAEYVLDRGHGRRITREEALNILKQAEEAGLVHMTENRSAGNAICNCCSCCCEMFRLMEHSGKKWILAPSRYVASVSDTCTNCGSCIDICPVAAITIDDIAVISADDCMGCGLCATACPVDAIELKEVRPQDHIPMSKK